MAGRRAPTHLAGPHVMVIGPHTAPGCGRGRRYSGQGLVQRMQASDRHVVSVECSQGALAVLPHSREGHVSMVPGMTLPGRSASSAPHPTSLRYHKKQETTPCRKTEHHQPDAA